MMFFSFIPPLVINGKATSTTNLPEMVESITVDDSGIHLKLKSGYEDWGLGDIPPELDAFKFGNSVSHINETIDPDLLPLELLPMGTIELLDAMAVETDSYVVIYNSEPPKAGYLEIFFADKLPFSVRRPNKTLYSRVSQLLSLEDRYLTPIREYSAPYEDYIVNALSTFSENVLQSSFNTLKDAITEGGTVEEITGIAERTIERSKDLVLIVTEQTRYIEERSRAYSRLIVPLIHQVLLSQMLSSHVRLVKKDKEVSLEILKTHKADAQAFLDLVINAISQ